MTKREWDLLKKLVLLANKKLETQGIPSLMTTASFVRTLIEQEAKRSSLER